MADADHRAARHHQGPRRGGRPPRGLGPRRSRREVAARRRGRRALRPGAAVRLDHRRRHRRLHHRRRARADGPHLRARHRQGARDRGRHRRRRAAAGHPDRAPRALLRPARRQGDARHRHRDRVRPGAPADVLRRLAVVRRRGRRRPSSSGGAPGPTSCPSWAPRPSRCSSCPTCQGVPPMLAGRLTLSVRYVWTGDAEEGERRFAAMREAAPVILDDVADKPYTAIDSVHTDPLDPTPAYEAADGAHRLPRGGRRRAARADRARASPSPQILVEVRQMGGAYARPGRAPERLRLARRGVLAAHRRHRRDPGRGGPRRRDPRGDGAVDRAATGCRTSRSPRRSTSTPTTR